MNAFDLLIFSFLCSLTPMILIFGAVPGYFDAPTLDVMHKNGTSRSVWMCMISTIFLILSSVVFM